MTRMHSSILTLSIVAPWQGSAAQDHLRLAYPFWSSIICTLRCIVPTLDIITSSYLCIIR